VTAATIGAERAGTGSSEASGPGSVAPQGVELRHLRYFVAVADAGTFTHAAERMFVAQPTLSQQIRRLEELVGTPLLQRRREGVRLTRGGRGDAGGVAGGAVADRARGEPDPADGGPGTAAAAGDSGGRRY
jgi:Bacterial regulatory helix-turn-helix protein, lysR family